MIFLEEQGVHKKNSTRFWVRMREIWSKQSKVLRIRTCSYELWLNWSFGDQSSRLRKKLKFLQNIPWKMSASKKDTWFRLRMREIWSKQAQVLRIRTCSYELQLNWSFGDRLSRLRKNFEILTEFSLKNKESIKKWYAIPSSDEGDMIETSLSAPYSNLLLWTPIELKFWGDLTSFL